MNGATVWCLRAVGINTGRRLYGIFSSLDGAKQAAQQVLDEQGSRESLWWREWGDDFLKGYEGETPDDQDDNDAFEIAMVTLDTLQHEGWLHA